MENLEEIDRFLANEMAEEERLDFLRRLADDETLAKELHYQQQIRAAALAHGKRQLQQRLIRKGRRKLFFNRWKGWLILLSCLLIVLIAWLLFQLNKEDAAQFPAPAVIESTQPVVLYRQYFTLPETGALLGEAEDNDWTTAIDYLQQGDCRAALPIMLEISTQKDSLRGIRTHFLIGTCQLAVDNAQGAITSLQQIPRTSGLYPEAQWYNALAYLALDQPDPARTILISISQNPMHPYAVPAGEILLELEE